MTQGALDALPSQPRAAVETALVRYAMTGEGDVKRLQGRDGFRMRVGSYRILFDEDQTTVLAINIGRRETTTYRKRRRERPMPDVQIIHSPSGEELVVLPRAEYDALVAAAGDADEDTADIALYDARKAELAGDPNPVLPAEVSAMLLRGHTRLQALRKWRGIAQIKLAADAGIAQGYLSDLEHGRKSGSAETIAALARALDIPVDWLT